MTAAGGAGRDRRAALAVAVLFFVNGATFSNWVPRIPEVRDRLGVSNAGLGAALLGGGLGGMVASVAAARLLERFGSRRCVLVAASGLACALPLISFAPSAAGLLVVLTVFGVLDVINDLAMNAQGVIVQARLRRSIMQRLHGAWSLGFLSGAAVGSLAGAARLDIRIHLLAVAVVLAATVQAARPALVGEPSAPDPSAPHDVPTVPSPTGVARALSAAGETARLRPRVTIVATALMAVGVAFMESMPNDWSAVTLHDVFDAGRWTGAGALLYAASMFIGRLGGDHALEWLGAGRLLDVAVGLAVVGIVLVAAAPIMAVALCGFAVWGLGVSGLFPQLYTLAATLPGRTAGAGLAAMALGQRSGFLLEPVLVGTVATSVGLRTALAVVSAAGLAATLISRRALARHTSMARRRG